MVRARTRAPTAAIRGSRRRRCCGTRATSCTRSTTCCSSTRRPATITFDATLLYSIQKDRFTKDSLYATQLPYNTQLWYDLGSGIAGNNLSSISEWALQSWMGRINYTLMDRYTFSATGRNDGSSRLAPGTSGRSSRRSRPPGSSATKGSCGTSGGSTSSSCAPATAPRAIPPSARTRRKARCRPSCTRSARRACAATVRARSPIPT